MKKINDIRGKNNQKWILFVVLLSFLWVIKTNLVQATSLGDGNQSTYSAEVLAGLQAWIDSYNRRCAEE